MEESGFIHAVEFDGKGGGRFLEKRDVWEMVPHASSGTVWLHLDQTRPGVREWLNTKSGLDAVVCEALLEEETRPRCVSFSEGLLVILRGVNLNAGADPEDMVSIRIWFDEKRIVSLRSERLMAAANVFATLQSGKGPRDQGEFLLQIAEQLSDQMDPVLDDLDNQIEHFYDSPETDRYALRARLSVLRRRIITLRRYIAPQRDVLAALQLENIPWISKHHRLRLREAAEQLRRFAEDLDATNQHAAIAQDDLESAFSHQLNRRMYMLALMTCIFLPLGFLTGLLGINIGGIPGNQNPHAFHVFCFFLGGVFVFQLYLFKKLKWL